MSDVSTRTIVINGDDSWPFRDLVLCHALDLYPLDSGVDMFNVVPPSDAEIGRDSRSYQNVIGNFPEDYSNEPDSLLEEIDERIANLAGTGRGGDYLALTLVLNHADFKALAMARDLESAAISATGTAGLKALRQAISAVQAQGDTHDENVVGRISTRVWFSLVVRDAGANSIDLYNAEKVYAIARDERIGVENIFFLSEGRGQDTQASAPTRHFAKLRLLIDVLAHSHTDAVQKSMRSDNARGFGVDPSKFMWVRSDQSELDMLANADLLRRDLIERFLKFTDPESRKKSEDWPTKFRAIQDKLAGALPGLKGDGKSTDEETDAYTEQRALNAVMTAAKNAQAANEEKIFEGLDAESEINASIRALGKRRRGWLYSASAPRKIGTNVAEYESALGQSRKVFETSVSQEIDTLRVDLENKRNDLHHTLDQITLPSTQDALQDVAGYSRDVLQEQAKSTHNEIADTREKYGKLDALSDRQWQEMREDRETAVQDVLATEDRLLRLGSALMVITGVALIALLPIMSVPLGLIFYGSAGTLDLGDIFGPMGVVMIFNVVIALVFALILASRLAHNRNIALAKLCERMGGHYDALKLSFAGLLRIAVNRWRLSLLTTVIGYLKPNQSADTLTPAEEFIDKLSAMQNSLAVPTGHLPDKTQQVLEAAFEKKGANPGERITSVLIADLPKPEESPLLSVVPSHSGASEFTLPNTASPVPLTLRLGAVGDE